MGSTHIKTLIFVTGALLGIVIGYTGVHVSEIIVCSLVVTLGQSAIYFFEKRNERRQIGNAPSITRTSRLSVPFVMLLFSLGMAIGLLRVQMVEEQYPYVCDGVCTFDATIISNIETKNEYQVFTVRPHDADQAVMNVQVRVPLYPRYQIGETVTLTGATKVPEVIMPHGDKKVFDYASYLGAHDIGSEMYYPGVEVIDTEAHDVISYLGRLKESFVSKIDTYVSAPASSLASGMLFGASSMSKELTDTFRAAGLSHIIVLSGFNIAIVISFILVCFSFVPLGIRVLLAGISVIIIVFMVGGEASVIRATLMAFVALLATLIGRKYAAHQALILSLFCIVMYTPKALLYDVSLHLSFLATAGIVYMTSVLEKYLTQPKSKVIRELSITTLAAYLATLPYIMYTFGKVSIYALVANMVVLPLVPGAMLLSFLVIVVSYVSETLSLLIGFIDTILINCIIFVARTVEALPFSSFSVTVSYRVMFVLYGVGVAVCFYLMNKKRNETKVTNSGEPLTDIISY